jgi:hypothetical protein
VASVAKPGTRKVEIMAATAEHRPLLDAFFKTVWPSDSPAESETRAATAAMATGDAASLTPSTIAVQAGRIIGYLGTLPLRLWDGRNEESAFWYKGFMVLPEFRNGPVGFGLVKEAAKRLPTALVITVQPASWRLFKAVGLTHLGALENRLRLLRPGRVLERVDPQKLGVDRLPYRSDRALKILQRLGLARVAGGVAGIGLSAWAGLRGSPSGRMKTSTVHAINPADYDELWSRVRPAIRFGQVRDGEYVRRQYQGGTRAGYSLIEARTAGELTGFGALRHPRAEADSRLAGLSVAVVSDLLFDPAERDVSLVILRSAERAAAALGADALVCSASHPSVLASLTARGYLRIPATLQFLARLGGGREPGSLRDWWLLRADGNSDEGL